MQAPTSSKPFYFDKEGKLASQIIISDSIEDTVETIKAQISTRVVTFIEEDFLVEHVKYVVKEAYIAEATTKYILIAAQSFNQYVQNSLLKLLEEPPPHICFILVSPSKSILLPTILSRLPLYRMPNSAILNIDIPFSFAKFDLETMTSFVKKHDRISKRDAKDLIQALFYKASHELAVLNKLQLASFERALPLIELNARPVTILTELLINFLPKSLL